MNLSKELKFTLFIALIFFIPFLITIFQFKEQNNQLQKLYTFGYLEMRTQSAARLVSDVLSENYNLSAIKEKLELKNNKSAALPELIKKLNSPYYEFVLLNSKQQETYRYSAGKKSEYNYSESAVIKEAALDKFSKGFVEYSNYFPPILTVAEPLENGGFLAARFSLAYISELVRRLGKNSYGNMGIMDAGGQVIADSLGISIVRSGMLAPEELLSSLENAHKENSSGEVQEVRGKKGNYLISISNILGTDWWFYEVIDTRFMPFSRANLQLKYTAIFGSFLIVIFSFAACVLAKIFFQKH